MTYLRIRSTLPDESERLIRRTIQCCLAVHRQLGPGFNEGTYARACRIELTNAGLAFENEKLVQKKIVNFVSLVPS
jgi:GxxExxY protein